MAAPMRVQLSRRKGWRMPPNTVSVARPTRWGNPWKVGDLMEADYTRGGTVRLSEASDAVDMFRLKLDAMKSERREAFLAPLRGKNLACWCPLGQPCHADVLLAIANARVQPRPSAQREGVGWNAWLGLNALTSADG